MSAVNIDDWICDVKAAPDSAAIGMILAHQGIVRGTSRSGELVRGMVLLTATGSALRTSSPRPGPGRV